MACSNCNQNTTNTNCGCQDQPITAAFNPTPNASCPDPTPCYETIQDRCVKHSLDYDIVNFGRLIASGNNYPILPAGASLENAYQAMSIEVLNENCLPPLYVHPTYIGLNSITLSWEDTGASYYIASIGTSEVGPFTPSVALNTTTYTFTSLNPGTQYYFKVMTNCSGGTYSYSCLIRVTTLSPA